MKNLIILLLILFAVKNLICQDIAYLYEAHLPAEIRQSPEFMKMVSQNIEKLAAIHPDLIYFYIQELKYKTDKFADGKFRIAALRQLQEIRNEYIIRRNSWVQSQLDILDKMDLNSRTKEKSKDYFKDLIIKKKRSSGKIGTAQISENDVRQMDKKSLDYLADSLGATDDIQISIDRNLADYYACIYYSKNAEESYDKYINYTKRKIALEDKIISKFLEFHQTENREPAQFGPKNLLLHWYLFQPNTSRRPHINSADFISTIISFKNKKAMHSGISIGFHYANYILAPEIEDQLYIYGLNSTVNISEDVRTSMLGFFAEYTFKIKKQLSSFSYLKLQMGLSRPLNLKAVNFSGGFETRTQSGDGTKEYQKLEFFTNEFDIKSMNSYYLKLNMPAYVLNNNLYIEAGLLLEYVQFEYMLSYSYHYVQKISYPTVRDGWYTQTIANKRGGALDVPKEFNEFIIYPILGIRYRFMRHFFLYLGSIPSNISLELSFNF